jgi:predicted ATP-dependent endonuclease of OLD family
MIIKKLYIHNYKNLHKIEIDNPTDFTTIFLIGENGCGKTNIFESIILILDYLLGKITRSKKSKNEPTFDFDLEYRIFEKSIRITNENVYCNDNQMLTDDLDIKMLPESIVLYSAGDSKRIYELIESTKLKNHIEILNLEYDVQKQICLDYFNSNNDNIDDLLLKKIVLYFQPARILKMINKEKFSKMTKNFVEKYVANKDKENEIKSNQTYKVELDKSQISDIKDSQLDLFEIVGELKGYGVFSSFTKTRKDYFELYLGNQHIEFSNLGEGEQLMHSLSATANRYTRRESLILMDEPDAFIHPKKLVKLIEAIKQLSCQTILTTHSPIILSNFKDCIGVVLGKEASKTIELLYGRKVEYLLEDVMDFDARPIDITRIIEDIDDKIKKNQIEQAKKQLSKLKERLGENDTDTVSLETQINITEYMSND